MIFGGIFVSEKRQQLIYTIGQSIAKYRQAAGLTQAQLAEILGIGNDAVSRMERGTTTPTITRLLELADIFHCEIADLVTDASHRPTDQARQLERMLANLDDNERFELLNLIERMLKWKHMHHL